MVSDDSILQTKLKLAVEGNDVLSKKLLSLEQENAKLQKELNALRYTASVKELCIEFLYDTGNGLSLNNRFVEAVVPSNTGFVQVSFTLPSAAKAISLNVGSLPCFIKDINYPDPEIPPASTGTFLVNNSFLFMQPNPSFAFVCANGFEANEQINFNFNYYPLNENESSGLVSALCNALLASYVIQ